MNESFDDAMVLGWESLESDIELPDVDDRHVVAAALRGRADAIVTENVKDFPAETLNSLGLEVIPLDGFLQDQFDLGPTAVCEIVREQAADMRNPPTNPDELLRSLERCGAPGFAATVRTAVSEWS